MSNILDIIDYEVFWGDLITHCGTTRLIAFDEIVSFIYYTQFRLNLNLTGQERKKVREILIETGALIVKPEKWMDDNYRVSPMPGRKINK